MQAEKQKDDVKSSILISIKCAMTLFAVCLSIYFTARYCEQIATGFDYAWQGIVHGWKIFLIPFVPVFNFIADLPIELSVAVFSVALWALCVTRKLLQCGLTGKFFKIMKNIFFCSGGAFFILCSFKAISVIGFLNYYVVAGVICAFGVVILISVDENKNQTENQ